MAEVTVHLNNDGLGGSRWWAEGCGFTAAADDIDELLDLIRAWAATEGVGDYRMTLVEDALGAEDIGRTDHATATAR